ncbi:MAG TPA: dihydrofolate reductase family protein [Thermoanaerobaculia bacterium]
MRKLIAAMKISLDGKMDGPRGADWVKAWSDDYSLTSQIDACLLGGGMYPGYEGYWTAVRNDPAKPAWTSDPPTEAEVEWARFTERTPHYVLSKTLKAAAWPNTELLRSPAEVAALKGRPGRDIYLIGGARTTASLIDAGLVDEVRLLVYPLIAGEGMKSLFETFRQRRGLDLRKAEPLPDDRVSLIYGTGPS